MENFLAVVVVQRERRCQYPMKTDDSLGRGAGGYAGWSRLEVLVVALVSGGLGVLSVPLAANGRVHGQLATCLASQALMQGAWQVYAEDNAGRLVGTATYPGTIGVGPDWAVNGYLNLGVDNAANTDLSRFPGRSPLWPYTQGSAVVFRCPSDPALVPVRQPGGGAKLQPRVRSRSMNDWVGGISDFFTLGGRWRQFRTLDSLVAPGPARTFTFIDEREDSLNDGSLLVSMDGFGEESVVSPAAGRIVDYPADWHDGAATVAFGDGHVEVRRWVDWRTTPPRRVGVVIPLNVASPNNPDVGWMQERATRRLP